MHSQPRGVAAQIVLALKIPDGNSGFLEPGKTAAGLGDGMGIGAPDIEQIAKERDAQGLLMERMAHDLLKSKVGVPAQGWMMFPGIWFQVQIGSQ